MALSGECARALNPATPSRGQHVHASTTRTSTNPSEPEENSRWQRESGRREDRDSSGRSRNRAPVAAFPRGSSAAATPRQGRWRDHDEGLTSRPRERVRRRMKKKLGAEGAREVLIDVESGGWSVHAPCPKGRAPNPGGKAAVLR
jgi:hypothetical protein